MSTDQISAVENVTGAPHAQESTQDPTNRRSEIMTMITTASESSYDENGIDTSDPFHPERWDRGLYLSEAGDRQGIAVIARRFVELHTGAGEVRLSIKEARNLGRYLLQAADDAEHPTATEVPRMGGL